MPESSVRSNRTRSSIYGKRSQYPPCIISIHDVMPQTFGEVKIILQLLETRGIQSVTLLIIPGLEWSDADLNLLHDFQNAGYDLAGHGWKHLCSEPKTVGHAIHSCLISRNVAEHLSLQSGQIAELIDSCFQWFRQAGLRPPALYVPPAWAMGRISRKMLHELPFRTYEYLTGIYDSETGSFYHLPLAGYEADTWLRAWALRLFNKLNHIQAQLSRQALRVAIHPHDLTLRLASELRVFLESPSRFAYYEDILSSQPSLEKGNIEGNHGNTEGPEEKAELEKLRG